MANINGTHNAYFVLWWKPLNVANVYVEHRTTKDRHRNKDEQWPWLSKTYENEITTDALQFQRRISVILKILMRMVRFLAFDAYSKSNSHWAHIMNVRLGWDEEVEWEGWRKEKEFHSKYYTSIELNYKWWNRFSANVIDDETNVSRWTINDNGCFHFRMWIRVCLRISLMYFRLWFCCILYMDLKRELKLNHTKNL